MTNKPSREELIKLLSQSGWHLEADKTSLKDRTLEEVVRAAHVRQTKGENPGIIKRIENALEIDLIQLQELWVHLGLPI